MKSISIAQSARVALVALALLLSVSDQARAEIPWQRSPSTAIDSARETNRPIVVYVATDWCHYCRIMNQSTWTDERVVRLIRQRFQALALDGEHDRQLVERLGLTGFPTTLLYTADGRYISHRSGYMSPDEIVPWLHMALGR